MVGKCAFAKECNLAVNKFKFRALIMRAKLSIA